MAQIKFSRLSLLSQKERRGLQIDFSAPATVLVAGNGFGKSAILKSLYEVFGAKPHKVDHSWRNATVTVLLEFTLGTQQFSALKIGDTFTIQDHAKNVLINTTHITAELAPFLADLLSFKLVLANKKDQIKIPPPSYLFAPFYVDQDRSWQKAWDAFSDLRMYPNSAKSLSEYHSGLRPNGFYEAKAERDRLKAELTKIEAERQAVDHAMRRIRESMPALPLAIDLATFSEETERLVSEGQALHNAQSRYRIELSGINEEFHLWSEHVAVVEAALGELDTSFKDALEEAPEVECPMCGEHYNNHIADQFELVADKDELFQTLQVGRHKLKELQSKLSDQRLKLDGVATAIAKVQQILAIHREDVSLKDVVTAEGRNEAQRVIQERLTVLDTECGEKQRLIVDAEKRMQDAESIKRKQAIKMFFSDSLARFTTDLDVRLPDKTRDTLQGLHIGRGSETPRALAAYYYAFLHTAKEHGSSAFCPIVVDSPNQQGQDKGHLEQIMQFLLTKMPAGAQVIIGAETMAAGSDAAVIDVSFKKNQVLREDAFETTLHHMRPFLRQSIF